MPENNKKDGRGGWRDGGRPLRFGEKTKNITIRIPESREAEIRNRFNAILKEYEKKD